MANDEQPQHSQMERRPRVRLSRAGKGDCSCSLELIVLLCRMPEARCEMNDGGPFYDIE